MLSNLTALLPSRLQLSPSTDLRSRSISIGLMAGIHNLAGGLFMSYMPTVDLGNLGARTGFVGFLLRLLRYFISGEFS